MTRPPRRETFEAIGELAAVLAHEVRNPLTSIRIDLQHVEETLPADSPLRVPLGRALREVQRLDQTVLGVLRFARSGTIAADLIDLRTPLRRAIEVAACAFAQSGARLAAIDVDVRPVPVRGDESALEQLFLNLLLNAAQALSTDGEAGVTVGVTGGWAVVKVWDSGSGIAADRLERVFDPFFSTKHEGTGLGLSVARQVVHAHGGSITIASDEETGTTVSVSLPSCDPGGAVAQR